MFIFGYQDSVRGPANLSGIAERLRTKVEGGLLGARSLGSGAPPTHTAGWPCRASCRLSSLICTETRISKSINLTEYLGGLNDTVFTDVLSTVPGP